MILGGESHGYGTRLPVAAIVTRDMQYYIFSFSQCQRQGIPVSRHIEEIASGVYIATYYGTGDIVVKAENGTPIPVFGMSRFRVTVIYDKTVRAVISSSCA